MVIEIYARAPEPVFVWQTKGVGTVAEGAAFIVTFFHVTIHDLSFKIYDIFLKFLENFQHYMDVCTNGYSSKSVESNCFKCC